MLNMFPGREVVEGGAGSFEEIMDVWNKSLVRLLLIVRKREISLMRLSKLQSRKYFAKMFIGEEEFIGTQFVETTNKRASAASSPTNSSPETRRRHKQALIAICDPDYITQRSEST